jgi:two-component system nitrogen regulation sensor histidine kinase NtrY
MMQPTPLVVQRRRRERIVVGVTALLIGIFGFLEGWLFRFDSSFPISSNILLFALINLNALLLLLLTYFVLRNIVKLLFERKRNILGHKLRTRLVIAFVGLALTPTIPLFLIATQFISSSLNYWFDNRIEQSLQQAVTIAQDYLEEEKSQLLAEGELVLAEVHQAADGGRPSSLAAAKVSAEMLARHHLSAVIFLGGDGRIVWGLWSQEVPAVEPGSAFPAWNALRAKNPSHPPAGTLFLGDQREYLAVGLGVADTGRTVGSDGELVVLRLLPSLITEKFATVTSGYENYLQLKLLQHPLKTSHFITFSIITLLVIFAAIWFGFFLAKSITQPIQEMVLGTQRIAGGDLDVNIQVERDDEIGMLVSSFNGMVRNLREIQSQLATAYQALQASHTELENRRRYMETVLTNIAAGVISVDAAGRVRTINQSAAEMFALSAEAAVGRSYRELLQANHVEIIESFRQRYDITRHSHFEEQVRTVVADRAVVLLVKVSLLKDEENHPLGVVVVLDDLTELEKAQRMAAWQEVARRIAHEVKNPLTPIKVSAERLRRKYLELGEADPRVLAECTHLIIEQVDHMQRLVNEFSQFARLPRAQPLPCDLGEIVESCLALYRHTYPQVLFAVERDGSFPLLSLDRDQFRQVMNNLLENAVSALNGGEERITVRLRYNALLRIATLECADTGHGLSPEDKLRIFEPYFSTKEKGTGLGLAIVASIVADHNGFVRVRDNSPQGTVISIELPA